MRAYCLLFLAVAPLAYGQLESDTLTIQASRTPTVQQPDQLVFAISVNSILTASLDDVLTALQGLGISTANLSTVYDDGGTPARLQWSFSLAVPIAKANATMAKLLSLQQSLAKSGYFLNVYGASSQVSPELLQSRACSSKDLIADARTQAQNVAAGAGFVVGEIVSLSGGGSAAVPSVVRLVADRPNATGVALSLVPAFDAPPLPCFLEVKFQLLRYQ